MNQALTIETNQSLQKNQFQFKDYFFTTFEKDKRIKEKTLQNYIVYLRHFAEWLFVNDIKNPTRKDIRLYQEHLDNYVSEKTGKHLEETSKQQYFQVVKTFFQFLENEGLYYDISKGIESFKVDRTEERHRAFTEDELQTILNSIDRSTTKGLRDYIMILLCITGGLRIIELQRANIEDLEMIDNQRILYIQGKGQTTKNNYVKIIPELSDLIDEYLATRKDRRPSAPLFTSTSNRSKEQRIAETSISRLFKKIFKDCGFNSRKLTAHSLRHSSNFILYELTEDIEKVREHSRHKDISTTQIYINHQKRSKNNFEQQIYNELFRKDSQKEREEIVLQVNQLSNEELLKVANYMKEIKEEAI